MNNNYFDDEQIIKINAENYNYEMNKSLKSLNKKHDNEYKEFIETRTSTLSLFIIVLLFIIYTHNQKYASILFIIVNVLMLFGIYYDYEKSLCYKLSSYIRWFN